VLVLDDPDVAPRVAGSLVYLGTVMPENAAVRPDVVLPIANTAEEDGTFVNRDGRVQRYFQATPAPGMARPAWWVLGELVAAAGGGEPPAAAADAFADLAAAVEAFGGLSYDALGFAGRPVARDAGVRT
jgi:predicted molibdopterin-dependent oxidoreductase YjgC